MGEDILQYLCFIKDHIQSTERPSSIKGRQPLKKWVRSRIESHKRENSNDNKYMKKE